MPKPYPKGTFVKYLGVRGIIKKARDHVMGPEWRTLIDGHGLLWGVTIQNLAPATKEDIAIYMQNRIEHGAKVCTCAELGVWNQ